MTKTTKGGKIMNPTDAYRKELRKKELKRNKKERKKVREVGILKKDPESLKEQIDRLEMMKAEGALDKARKHKKRQLEDTLNLVLKKRKLIAIEHEDKQKEKGETPVMFSHLGLPLRRTDEEERAKHPKPEDSVYYHPTLNPTGAPPPGKLPMFKSTIGPRIPEESTSDVASSSTAVASTTLSESEEAALAFPPLPPLPPLPPSGDVNDGDSSVDPALLPLPAQPPMPPNPAMTELGTQFPMPPLPPPPPGPPPKDLTTARLNIPPPPPPRPTQQSTQPPPPGTGGNESESNPSAKTDDPNSKERLQAQILPPPPPPSGLPPKMASNQSEGAQSESDAKSSTGVVDYSKMMPPPPPPRQQAPAPMLSQLSNLQPDVLPPGLPQFRLPPPPPDMRPPFMPPGHPGMMVPPMPRPPFGPPPGLPPMMRPPLPPGPPPLPVDDTVIRPTVPQKPSFVKSAASTVVKRPLAQHTPELTAMVPASVRVRRETAAASKPKPKSSVPVLTATTKKPVLAPTVTRSVPPVSSSPSVPKPPSVDDSYMAFLEDMKALGALDG